MNFSPHQKTKLFINKKIDKKNLENLILQVLTQFGTLKTISLVDSIKTLGFRYATNAGISIGIEDLKIPREKKTLLDEAQKEICKINENWKNSLVTDIERFQKIIDTWNNSSESLKNKIIEFFKKSDPLNSIYMIAFSGARGNISQVRQLIGMRGLMADQKGQIIDLPIISNFREGLSCSDYIISSYGARKGIVDTALRTADSGYLTRRLVEVAQDILIRDIDCSCNQGIRFDLNFYKNFKDTLKGRSLAHRIKINNDILVEKNQILNDLEIDKIQSFGVKKLYLRSPLTCKSYRAICQYCYGWNLAYRQIVNLGDSVGVIAAQSIGEPGTQMTMRTFHTGGVFTTEMKQQIKSQISGIIYPLSKIRALSTRSPHGKSVLKLENQVIFRIRDWKNRVQIINLIEGSLLYFNPGSFVTSNHIIAEVPTSSSSTKFPKRDFKSLLSTTEGEIYYGSLNIKESLRKQRAIKYNEKAGLIWILAGLLKSFPNETKLFLRQRVLNRKKAVGKIKLVCSKNALLKLNYRQKEISLFTKLFNLDGILKIKYVNFEESLNKNKKVFSKILLKKSESSIFFNLFYDKEKNQFDLKKEFNSFLKVSKKKISKTNLILLNNLKFSSFSLENLNVSGNKNGFLFFVPNKPWILSLTKSFKSEKSSRILFPGENLFENFSIQNLCFLKIINVSNSKTLFLIFPIFQIQIKKQKNFQTFLILRKKSNSTTNYHLLLDFYHGKNLKLDKLNKILFFENFTYSSEKNGYSKIFLQGDSKKKNFNLIQQKQIKLKNLLNGRILCNNEVKINLLVKDRQIIEPQTIIGFFEYIPKKNENIFLIKRTKSDRQEFLFICSSHLTTLYSEEKIEKPFTLLEKSISITKNLLLKNSGLFLKKTANHIYIRKAFPYFLTKGAIIRYGEGEFVKKNENFAILVNYKKQTEDIVQGLPKIEELIELRGNNQNAILCEKPGILYRIESNQKEYELEILEKDYNTIYFLESIENLIVKKFDFLTLGQPITTGTIDPYELLRVFCNFYYKRDGIVKGLYKSLYKLQQILVHSIQAIYKSQGIDISDKHLEIIVRQMSSQVEIRDPGDSPLLPGETLEVYLIEDLCNILLKRQYQAPVFQPILLGVTRSSLKSESFLSSSSFQETRKMLAEAAIEGKVDWLRSLKANVITGRLIPSGTGFNNFKQDYNHPDLYDLLKFFSYRETEENQELSTFIDENNNNMSDILS